MNARNQVLDVWGELACFSRPELKVERFSYPVITPSAARGIFDAIYCKPTEFRWQIIRVELLAHPSYIALRRNEVKQKAAVGKIGKWMNGSAEPEPILADDSESDFEGRTQRQTMALKDVHYRLHAEARPWPGFEPRQQGIEEQFRRRASQGKCFYQPYFGCREFPAYFGLVQEDPPGPPTVDLNLDVGLMLYDVFDLSRPGGSEDEPCISLFRATVRGGVMTVPHYDSDDVLKGRRQN
jgi:CRISPR-associated protein Cas5d